MREMSANFRLPAFYVYFILDILRSRVHTSVNAIYIELSTVNICIVWKCTVGGVALVHR